MADITLAECNNRAWLVGGESFIDDLLANTLAPEISIEIVACASPADVRDLWVQNCGQPSEGGMPWVIHPNIVARIRRASPDFAVFFAQWSAMLDEDAQASIRAAAVWAEQNPTLPVLLAEYLDPDGPQVMADLSRLRTQLIEERLAGFAVDRARIGRIRRGIDAASGMAQESQRVDIIIRPA
jgi:hypothetical protein